MQAEPPLLRTVSQWSDSLLCSWCPSINGTVTQDKGGQDWWGSLAAFCPMLGLPLLWEWAGHREPGKSCVGEGPSCSELLQCCGLSCPGAGHVSGTAATNSKPGVFPSSPVQTLVLPNLPGGRAPAEGLEPGVQLPLLPRLLLPSTGSLAQPWLSLAALPRERETSSDHLWLILGTGSQ